MLNSINLGFDPIGGLLYTDAHRGAFFQLKMLENHRFLAS
jgi:hypothetical protein